MMTKRKTHLVLWFTLFSLSSAADLWAALRHSTGFSDEELGYLAEELLKLPAPWRVEQFEQQSPLFLSLYLCQSKCFIVFKPVKVQKLPIKHCKTVFCCPLLFSVSFSRGTFTKGTLATETGPLPSRHLCFRSNKPIGGSFG